MSKIDRRQLLAAAPAAGFAAMVAGAVPVEAMAETPIMDLYRRYVEINTAAQAYVYDLADGDDEDEVAERLFYRFRDQVEDQLMATPAVTAQDMAAKMIVAHKDGDFTCLHYDRDPVWAEARALVGA